MKRKSHPQSIAKSMWTTLQYIVLIPCSLWSVMMIFALLANLAGPVFLKSEWTTKANQLTGVTFSQKDATVIDTYSQTHWNGEGQDYVKLKLNSEKVKVLLEKIQQDPQWKKLDDSSFCGGQSWEKSTDGKGYRASVYFCARKNILELRQNFY